MTGKKVIKAVVEPEFKNKVVSKAKKEGVSERAIIVKAIRNYLEKPL